MARVSPQEYADKWARRTRAAVEDYRRGVQRVDTAPGQKAAEAADLLLQRIMDAIQSGRWQDAVSSVSLQEWREAVLEKGAARLPQGVDAARDEVAQIARELLQAVDQAAAEARSLPKGTLEDSIRRMETFARRMHELAPKRRRGG